MLFEDAQVPCKSWPQQSKTLRNSFQKNGNVKKEREGEKINKNKNLALNTNLLPGITQRFITDLLQILSQVQLNMS